MSRIAVNKLTNRLKTKEIAVDALIDGSLRSLKPSGVPPTVRDNGQPLEVSDQWPNTVDGMIYVWSGSEWVPLNESLHRLLEELSDPYNSLLGFIRGPFGGNPLTVRGMLSSQMLAVTEFQDVIPSGDKPDTSDPSTWYWDAAINAAMQKGKMVYLHNMVKIKRKISSKVTGAQLIGDGVDSAGLILDSTFEGDCAVQLGDSSSDEATTTHIGIQGVSIFMAGKSIPAVTMLGCRDSSYAKGVYIRDFSGVAFKTNKAGNGSGNATGKMCQGVKIEQIVAFPQRAVTGDIFLLDGIFESDISSCKAFGYALAENTAVGFSVGKNTESRGVRLSLCSAANMIKGASPVNPEINVGIMYGQWARDCWDYNTNLENIEGMGVVFNGGTASGLFLPLNCRSVDVRPFASANLSVLNPLYSFKKANSCFSTGVNYFSTVKCTFDFTDDGPVNCWGGMDGGGVNPDALVSSGVIRFGPLAPLSNFVEGHSSDTTTRKEFVVTKDQQFYRVLPNGASEQTDQFYTTHNMGPVNRERWRNAVLAVAFIIDGNEPDSGQTSISVRVSKSGVPGTDRVLVGPPDSGGTGYRTLRIAN